MADVEVGEYKVDLLTEIGRGRFGTVYKGWWDTSNVSVAAKKISGRAGSEISEVKALYRLQTNTIHAHIIRVYDVKNDNDSIYIMMELCDLGDLNEFFKTRREFSQQLFEKINLMEQIASGIAFLHSNGIAHRDIKPENILVKSLPQRQFLAKLGDFGLSKILDPDCLTSAMSSNVGSLLFKAPEFFNPELRYHRNVDVYSAGLTFTAMLQAQPGKSLVPKAEGSLTDNEAILPIGIAEYTRMVSNCNAFTVVENKPNDDDSTKEVKKLIRKMTWLCPKHRLESVTVQQKLEQILRVSCTQYLYKLSSQSKMVICIIRNHMM